MACVLEAEDVAVEFVECVWDEVWQLAEEKACLLEGVPAVGDGCVCCFLCVGYEVCNHLFSFRLGKWLRTGLYVNSIVVGVWGGAILVGVVVEFG